MNFTAVLSLNIFAALISFAYPESFFQFSLLVVTIILTLIKIWEMVIQIKLKKEELKQLREKPEPAPTPQPPTEFTRTRKKA